MNEPSQTSSSPSSSASGTSRTSGIHPRLWRGIVAVRQRLPRAREFSELFDLFDDRVARAPGLWDQSHLRDNEVLRSVAAAVGPMCHPGFAPEACMFYEVADTGFWHGAVVGSNALGCLFYDAHQGRGLLALSNPFDGTHWAHYARFTRTTLDPPQAEGTTRLAC